MRFLKWTFLFLMLVLISGLLFVRFAMGMSLPEGKSGAEADAIAERMMERIGIDAWNETRFVSWTFANRNTYIWDRSESLVHISAGDTEAVLNTTNHTGWAKENGSTVSELEHDRLMEWAWSNFCNDSFWLIAPLKVMDKDTKRELVNTENGNGLLVTYMTGGVTPGDSYLWYLDDSGLPTSYRMWVGIIPVPGVKVTWEDWTSLHSGALIAQKHMLGPMNISITNLKSGSSIEEIGLSQDPFKP